MGYNTDQKLTTRIIDANDVPISIRQKLEQKNNSHGLVLQNIEYQNNPDKKARINPISNDLDILPNFENNQYKNKPRKPKNNDKPKFKNNDKSKRMNRVDYIIEYSLAYLGAVGGLYIFPPLAMVGIIYSLIVSSNRFHDINKSGLNAGLTLIPIFGVFVIVYLMISSGDKEANKYGDPPKKSGKIKTLFSIIISFILVLALVIGAFFFLLLEFS